METITKATNTDLCLFICCYIHDAKFCKASYRQDIFMIFSHVSPFIKAAPNAVLGLLLLFGIASLNDIAPAKLTIQGIQD